MKLKLFPDTLALCKLAESANLNSWLGDGPLHVLINDPHGKTVICAETFADDHSQDVVDRSLWRFFQIDEIFDVDSIGVVAEFSNLLAGKEISVFVISSYETDYLLVQPGDTATASSVFQQAGHTVTTL